MTPRSLFNIIIKIFGLFFLREIINTVPQLVSSFLFFTKDKGADDGIWAVSFLTLIMAIYVFLVFLLLFKTNYFIDKLRLDKGFDQAEFSFNISTSLVLNISLIVIGGYLLINEIPNFCRQLYSYFQEKKMTYGMTKPDISFSIIAAFKVIVGLLIIGERKRIIELIESRQKKSSEV